MGDWKLEVGDWEIGRWEIGRWEIGGWRLGFGILNYKLVGLEPGSLRLAGFSLYDEHMKIVSVEQMRQLEKRADAAGVTYAQMMEAAGRAVADEILRRGGAEVRRKRVLVLVGPGNNGGDGLVAARYLHDAGVYVSLYLWHRKTEGDLNFERAKQHDVFTLSAETDENFAGLHTKLNESDMIIDALLGTGANRPIEGTLKEILLAIKKATHRTTPKSQSPISQSPNLQPPISQSPNLQLPTSNFQPPTSDFQSPKQIVAVDLPSGLNADTGALDPVTAPADLTVTFAYSKVGFYKFPAANALGELVVADIGIPSEFAEEFTLNLATREAVQKRLPPRPRDGHKGTFGKAMIVSGSANYTGAPYLSAAAAARVGAGLVTLATTVDVQRMVAASLHEATYLPLVAQAGAISVRASKTLLDNLQGYDALLIGPGLGRAPTTQQFLYRVLGVQNTQREPERKLPPLIVDADGLNALSAQREWWKWLRHSAVLTPHVGEFARLSRLSTDEIKAKREDCAREFAQQWNQVLLLKGAFTLVAEPNGQVTLLPFATAALATAGSGDVLSGMIVGLLAQGLAPRDAAILGGYVHGMAGEWVAHEVGEAGAVAGDLLPRIPLVLTDLKRD